MASASNDPLPPIDALVAAIRAGDERTIAGFMDRYEPMLRRVLRVTGKIRWLQSQVESQDLVQSVFIQVVDAIRIQGVQFEDESALEGYLRTVGRHRLRDTIRRLKAARRDQRRTIAGDAAGLDQVPQGDPTPSHLADVREQVARVENCAAASDIKVLRERADGADWQQLANELNTTPEALRKRIARVRQRIQETLGLGNSKPGESER